MNVFKGTASYRFIIHRGFKVKKGSKIEKFSHIYYILLEINNASENPIKI